MAIVLEKAVAKHYGHIFSKKVLLKASGTGKDTLGGDVIVTVSTMADTMFIPLSNKQQ
jgi:hypothetical protein